MSVSELLGELEYRDIPLPVDSSILFLMGENASGKTTILKIIEAASSGAWDELAELPFGSATFSFSDQTALGIVRDADSGLRGALATRAGPEIELPELRGWMMPEGQTLTDFLTRRGRLKRLNCGHYEDTVTHSGHMTAAEIQHRFAPPEDLPDQLEDLVREWQVRLISADRQFVSADRHKELAHRVAEIPDELSKVLSGLESQANKALLEANGGLVETLLSPGEDEASGTEVEAALNTYESKRKSLAALGLAQGAKEFPVPDTAELNGVVAGLLVQSLDGMTRSLDSYGAITQRAEAFLEMVRGALRRKSVALNPVEGLSIGSNTGPIAPLELSSGEQQQLILAYELLFVGEDGGLVLVDEPELSLDVGMQTDLAGILERIADGRSMRFVLATHSPLVISGSLAAGRAQLSGYRASVESPRIGLLDSGAQGQPWTRLQNGQTPFGPTLIKWRVYKTGANRGLIGYWIETSGPSAIPATVDAWKDVRDQLRDQLNALVLGLAGIAAGVDAVNSGNRPLWEAQIPNVWTELGLSTQYVDAAYKQNLFTLSTIFGALLYGRFWVTWASR